MFSINKMLYSSLILALLCSLAFAQTGDLKLLDWQPASQMVVKETKIIKAKFPVIDIHSHLGDLEKTAHYLEEMDKAGVWKCVSLDGKSKDNFYKEHLKVSQSVSKDRFLIFFRPDVSKINEPNFGINEAKKLEEAVKLGARGLKIWKDLGLGVKDKSGKLITVDDPRMDPIWAKCGELGIPVEMHIADPSAFFTPLDKYRSEERRVGKECRSRWSPYH